MADQSDPISPDEYILRRVPYVKQNPNYIDISLSQPVHPVAFRPTDKDVEGLSVYRELFVSADDIAKRHKKRTGKECYVVRIKAEVLFSSQIGVTVIPDPIKIEGELPGHSLIPELNSVSYVQSKNTCKDLQKNIADLLTMTDVAHRPMGDLFSATTKPQPE